MKIQLDIEEATRIVKRLELDASYDKVGSIYYKLKKFVEDSKK